MAEIAPPNATCPGCGFEVGGYVVRTNKRGQTCWDRPTKWVASNSGMGHYADGLTHVLGGSRCRE